jgi:hypothetical protein
MSVVLLDGVEPLRRDAPAADDVLQEGPDIIKPFGAAEAQHQQGINLF